MKIQLLVIFLLLFGAASAKYSTGLEIASGDDITLSGGGKVTGLANGTALTDAIPYTQWRNSTPLYYYDGTTFEGLNNYIAATGPGTYYLQNVLTCNSAVNLSTAGVRIVGAPNARTSAAPGRITTTLASGTMLTISANDIEFVNLAFVASNTTSTVDMVKLAHPTTDKSYIKFFDCYWTGAAGKMLYIGDHIQRAYLVRCELEGVGTGYGLYADGASADSAILTNTVIGNVDYGIYIIDCTAVEMEGGLLGHIDIACIYLAPDEAEAASDLWIRGVLIDTGNHAGVVLYCATNYVTSGLIFTDNRVIPVASSGTPFLLNYINKFRIGGNVISVATSPGNIFNLVKRCTNGTMTDNTIVAMTGWGINIDGRTGDDLNKNILVNDNVISTTGDGIYVGSGNKNIAVNDNVATVEDHSAAPHSIADNVAKDDT